MLDYSGLQTQQCVPISLRYGSNGHFFVHVLEMKFWELFYLPSHFTISYTIKILEMLVILFKCSFHTLQFHKINTFFYKCTLSAKNCASRRWTAFFTCNLNIFIYTLPTAALFIHVTNTFLELYVPLTTIKINVR